MKVLDANDFKKTSPTFLVAPPETLGFEFRPLLVSQVLKPLMLWMHWVPCGLWYLTMMNCSKLWNKRSTKRHSTFRGWHLHTMYSPYVFVSIVPCQCIPYNIYLCPSHPEAINFMVVTVKGYCLRKAIV